MAAVARFWVRDDGAILGKVFEVGASSYKTNHVYEIRELLGESAIIDLGLSALPSDPELWKMAPEDRPVPAGMRLDQVGSSTGGMFLHTPEEWVRTVKAREKGE